MDFGTSFAQESLENMLISQAWEGQKQEDFGHRKAPVADVNYRAYIPQVIAGFLRNGCLALVMLVVRHRGFDNASRELKTPKFPEGAKFSDGEHRISSKGTRFCVKPSKGTRFSTVRRAERPHQEGSEANWRAASWSDSRHTASHVESVPWQPRLPSGRRAQTDRGRA
jgi:hypothetical protein